MTNQDRARMLVWGDHGFKSEEAPVGQNKDEQGIDGQD